MRYVLRWRSSTHRAQAHVKPYGSNARCLASTEALASMYVMVSSSPGATSSDALSVNVASPDSHLTSTFGAHE